MKRLMSVLVCTMLLVVLAGCGDIQDAIEKLTEREITVHKDILNSQSGRDSKAVLVAENLEAQLGIAEEAGLTEISDLSEPIEVTRLGLGDVRFYVKGRLINEGHTAARVSLYVLPGAPEDNLPAMEIGTVTLQALEDYELEKPGDMDQTAQKVHERLTDLFLSLDERYLVNPVIYAEGAAEAGVHVSWLKLAAVPVLWRSEALETSGLSGYKKNIREIRDASLEGSITNEGTDLAEVRLYLGTDADNIGELVAQGFVEPGETRYGFDLLVIGGEHAIKQAIKAMIEGDGARSDLIVITENPLLVNGNRFRIQAKAVIGLDIF